MVVVHNGIIENYLALKSRLVAAGHRFTTQTDTEIVAHLVESHLGSASLEDAVRREVDEERLAALFDLPEGHEVVLGNLADQPLMDANKRS